uniref:Uncharacterized protein n=4 Tax=Avena sativa TaxID=4498 RepID=A0ACD5Z0L7_AVESA
MAQLRSCQLLHFRLAAPTQLYAGDVRHSLSAEPDSSMRNGEDIPRRNDSEDDDSSIVVLIGTPDEVGNVVRGGVEDLAGAPLQRTGEASSSSGLDSSVVVLIGKPADGGSLVRGRGRGRVGGAAKKAVMDVFLADPSRDDFMVWFTLAVKLCPVYWVQELVDWMKGSQRHPIKWSWLGVVGHRIQQNNDTCAICGTLVCLEARHRLAFERLHGFKTFPCSITTETVTALKNLCEQRGVWTERYGADEQDVLEVIRSSGGCAVAAGVPGWNPCRLQVKSWKYHRNSAWQPMSQSKIAKLIHMEGPILGGIKVDDDWYYAEGWEDSVYRGVPRGYKGADNHLVVCTGYHLLGFEPTADRERAQKRQWHRYGQIETELYVEVVDNQLVDGPVRWILASAFDGFVEIHVDTTELWVKKPSLWRRLLDTVSRIFSLWHGD